MKTKDTYKTKDIFEASWIYSQKVPKTKQDLIHAFKAFTEKDLNDN